MSLLIESRLRLICAVIIASIFLLASYAKVFHPSAYIARLDFWVAIFELGLLTCLLIFRNRVVMWLITGSVFACWAGYALFWWRLDMPCGCLGSIIVLPLGASLIGNICFFAVSLEMARQLKAETLALLGVGLGGVLFAWGGFSAADWVYNHLVLA